MTSQKKPKLPIILYEEPKPGLAANPIPYIELGVDDDIPNILFISSHKETGEFEADAEHGSAAIVDMQIHPYVRMDFLKQKLSPERYDEVRIAFGMKPLSEASAAGQKVLDRVNDLAEKNLESLKNSDEKKSERAFVLGEDLRHKAKEFLKQRKKEEKEN